MAFQAMKKLWIGLMWRLCVWCGMRVFPYFHAWKDDEGDVIAIGFSDKEDQFE